MNEEEEEETETATLDMAKHHFVAENSGTMSKMGTELPPIRAEIA